MTVRLLSEKSDEPYQLLLKARNLDWAREDVGDKVHLVGVSDLVLGFKGGGRPERNLAVSFLGDHCRRRGVE